MYLLPHFTQKLNTQELCLNTLTLERKHSSADIARFFFWLSKHLAHSTQSNPRFSLCCLSGKIKLPQPLLTPHLLDDLPNNIFGQKSKRFRANIRAYNSMFACISMGANVD